MSKQPRIALSAAATLAALVLAQPASARDQCIAVMQVVGIPADVAAASDEDGEDRNGDGQIWSSSGSGRMTGYIDCSDVPGSSDGDMYEQNYSTGEMEKVGNSPGSSILARKQFARSGQRSTSTGSTSGSNRSSSANDDARPAAGQSAIAKKKKPVAQTQR